VTDVNEDPDNTTVTIDEDIPENNSALQNQNTENINLLKIESAMRPLLNFIFTGIQLIIYNAKI
jgi:hypothetical protein